MKKQLHIGIGLQLIFILLFFTGGLPGKIYGAIFALVISLYSLSSGIRSFRQRYKPGVSLAVSIMGIVLLAFTLFAYFTGEGGIPPAFKQF